MAQANRQTHNTKGVNNSATRLGAADAQFFVIGGARSNGETLKKAIGRLGFNYSLHFVRSIDHALTHMAVLRSQGSKAEPDLIILMQAALMPDGSRALARLREDETMADVPIVVVTIVHDPGLRRTLLDLGVCTVVSQNDLVHEAALLTDVVVNRWFNKAPD